MKKIKQFLCPFIGTIYLVGGYEFGHSWRHIRGTSFIICKKCYAEKYFLTYRKDEKIAQELASKAEEEETKE